MGGEAGHAAEEWTYSTEHFDLRSDLANLERVHQVGAPEATIFYCAGSSKRSQPVRCNGWASRRAQSVFTNLERLQNHDRGSRTDALLRPRTSPVWQRGSAYRAGQITTDDADMALLFAALRRLVLPIVADPSRPRTGGRSLVLSRREAMR